MTWWGIVCRFYQFCHLSCYFLAAAYKLICMLKISFLTLPLTSLISTLILTLILACEPHSSSRLSDVGQIDLIERPSLEEAAIIARNLPYQDDDRISYCEVLATDKTSYSGYRDQKLYPLASLSKVITTAWVLKRLGPDHHCTESFL